MQLSFQLLSFPSLFLKFWVEGHLAPLCVVQAGLWVVVAAGEAVNDAVNDAANEAANDAASDAANDAANDAVAAGSASG